MYFNLITEKPFSPNADQLPNSPEIKEGLYSFRGD